MHKNKFLSGIWYFGLNGQRLKKNRTLAKTILNKPVLFGRRTDGSVFAMHGICPHRGMPLRHATFDGEQVACNYHGWRFNGQGQCVGIPCLSATQAFETEKVKISTYPCREVQGNIWIYFPADSDKELAEDALPPVYQLPEVANRSAHISLSMKLECDIDSAALGLIDPAHTPYVHHSPIWRSPDARTEKQKHFVPSGLGFKMARHKMSSNSTAYKILGADPEVEIDFQLPGLRSEYICAGEKQFCGFTTVTPITETESEINHNMYWNIGWLSAFKYLIKPIMIYFLNQDRVAMQQLGEGLAYHQRNMFVRDPDLQSKWYFSLKKDYQAAMDAGEPFVNSLEETTLCWRT